mgnify:CR=1 FL=1
MKKLIVLLVLVLFCAGCTGGSYSGGGTIIEEKTWAVRMTNHWTTRDAIPLPQQGYHFLVVVLEVSNLTQKEQYLSQRATYIAPNGNEYSSSFLNSSDFPIRFMPQQARRGSVYFEIPESYNPSEGFLVFRAGGNMKDLIVEF